MSPDIVSTAKSTAAPPNDEEFERNATFLDAWDCLRKSIVYFRGDPVGTIAAMDPSENALNYDQVLKSIPNSFIGFIAITLTKFLLPNSIIGFIAITFSKI